MDSIEEKKEYFENAFNTLKNNIGKQVSCIYWEFGKLNGYRGILQDVVPYDFINVEGNVINFVGERTAIQCVIIQEKDLAYSIFQNPMVQNYHGSFRDPMQVIEAQKRFLGLSVMEQEILNKGGKHL